MKDLFHNVYEVIEENGRYCPTRFTQKQICSLDRINPSFANNGRTSAGVSLVFDTDSEEISFSYQYNVLYTTIGGFDVYENGKFLYNQVLPISSCEGTFRYRKETSGLTRLEIFLPANAQMWLWDFHLGNFSFVEQEKNKTILFYGDSITQSAYFPTPSLSFAPTVARKLSAKFINRGVGSLFYDVNSLDENDTIHPDIILIILGLNDLAKHQDGELVVVNDEVQFCDQQDIPYLIGNAEAYLGKMKQIYPNAEIFCVPLFWCPALKDDWALSITDIYEERIRNLLKEMDIVCVEGCGLTPHLLECYAPDRIHHSALGAQAFANSILEYLA
ncbi:MAG: hypothetical protein IKK11_06540 [Oscillospiraceae bacterium]|nr:hypothetical protein [Oscillospiraceae bacterium]